MITLRTVDKAVITLCTVDKAVITLRTIDKTDHTRTVDKAHITKHKILFCITRHSNVTKPYIKGIVRYLQFSLTLSRKKTKQKKKKKEHKKKTNGKTTTKQNRFLRRHEISKPIFGEKIRK